MWHAKNYTVAYVVQQTSQIRCETGLWDCCAQVAENKGSVVTLCHCQQIHWDHQLLSIHSLNWVGWRCSIKWLSQHEDGKKAWHVSREGDGGKTKPSQARAGPDKELIRYQLTFTQLSPLDLF